MPGGLYLSLGLARQRRNPVRLPRRDLVIQQGDDLTLDLTVYDRDGDTVPLDVSAGAVLFSLRPDADYVARANDYGWHGWSGSAAWFTAAGALATDGTDGRLLIVVPGEVTARWRGRYGFHLAFGVAVPSQSGIGVVGTPPVLPAPGAATLLSGVLLVERAVALQVANPGLLDTIGILPDLPVGNALLDGSGATILDGSDTPITT